MRADDVALLLVSQAVGVGKRAERGTHFLQGLRGRSALCTSPAAIPAFEATSGEQSSTLRPPPATGRRLFPLGRPSGEQGSIRSVVPGQETDPRFLRRETLEKPESDPSVTERPFACQVRPGGRGYGSAPAGSTRARHRDAGYFHHNPSVTTRRTQRQNCAHLRSARASASDCSRRHTSRPRSMPFQG